MGLAASQINLQKSLFLDYKIACKKSTKTTTQSDGQCATGKSLSNSTEYIESCVRFVILIENQEEEKD